jgi:hypothetical protein
LGFTKGLQDASLREASLYLFIDSFLSGAAGRVSARSNETRGAGAVEYPPGLAAPNGGPDECQDKLQAKCQVMEFTNGYGALRLTLGAMRRPPGIFKLIPGALELAKSCKNRPHQTVSK